MSDKDEAEIENSTINAFDEPETEEATEATADEATEEVTEETEEKGEEESKDESESPSQPHVPIAALTAERRKRQEAEAKLKQIEEDIPDPVESPKEYADFVRNASQTNALQDRINLSRSILVDMDPDYTRYEAEFMNAVAKQGDEGVQIVNQDLYNQFVSSDNPAKFARDMGKDILTYRERSAPDYEERLKQKWLAEQQADVPDLTSATAEGSNSEPVDKPANLSSVFDGSLL